MRQQLLGAARNGRSAATGAAGTTRTGRAAPRRAGGRAAPAGAGGGEPGPSAAHRGAARRTSWARGPRGRRRLTRDAPCPGRGPGSGGRGGTAKAADTGGPAGCASFDPEVELQARRLLIGSRQDGTNTRGAPGGHARRLQGGRRGQGRRALRGGLRVGHPCAGSRRPAGACDDLSNRLEGERETEAPEAPPFCLPSGRPSVHTRPARLLRCLPVSNLPSYFLGDQLSGFP